MLGNRQELARSKSDFYRDKYRSTLNVLLFSICLSVILIGSIIYLVLFKAPPQYYASTIDGQIISLTPSSG